MSQTKTTDRSESNPGQKLHNCIGLCSDLAIDFMATLERMKFEVMS